MLLFSSGCAPHPDQATAAAPAFASDDEAFAAAELTYRAYNDALNQVDPANPQTFEAAYAFTADDFEASDKENFTNMRAEHTTIVGESIVTKFLPRRVGRLRETVSATVCVDVSAVDVLDASGTSVVSPDRPDVYALDVDFRVHGDRLLLESATTTDGHECTA